MGCARSIQDELSDIAGVHRVDVSFEEKNAVIHFDPSETTKEQLVASVNAFKGGTYHVTKSLEYEPAEETDHDNSTISSRSLTPDIDQVRESVRTRNIDFPGIFDAIMNLF